MKNFFVELIPGLADCADIPYAEDMMQKIQDSIDIVTDPGYLVTTISKNMIFHGSKILSYSMDSYQDMQDKKWFDAGTDLGKAQSLLLFSEDGVKLNNEGQVL